MYVRVRARAFTHTHISVQIFPKNRGIFAFIPVAEMRHYLFRTQLSLSPCPTSPLLRQPPSLALPPPTHRGDSFEME